jgi:hypothetical protein
VGTCTRGTPKRMKRNHTAVVKALAFLPWSPLLASGAGRQTRAYTFEMSFLYPLPPCHSHQPCMSSHRLVAGSVHTSSIRSRRTTEYYPLHPHRPTIHWHQSDQSHHHPKHGQSSLQNHRLSRILVLYPLSENVDSRGFSHIHAFQSVIDRTANVGAETTATVAQQTRAVRPMVLTCQLSPLRSFRAVVLPCLLTTSLFFDTFLGSVHWPVVSVVHGQRDPLQARQGG